MQFSPQYKQKAIELYEEYTMTEVFQQLLKIFPNKHHPNEKTIRRWKHEATMLEKQIAESAEHTKEIGSKYWETHTIPKWLQHLYLVKIENGEIKFL